MPALLRPGKRRHLLSQRSPAQARPRPRLFFGARSLLDQVLGEWVSNPDELEGRGRLVSELGDSGSNGLDGSAVFGSASIGSADDEVVADHLTSALGSGVGLGLGAVQRTPAVTPNEIKPGRPSAASPG